MGMLKAKRFVVLCVASGVLAACGSAEEGAVETALATDWQGKCIRQSKESFRVAKLSAFLLSEEKEDESAGEKYPKDEYFFARKAMKFSGGKSGTVEVRVIVYEDADCQTERLQTKVLAKASYEIEGEVEAPAVLEKPIDEKKISYEKMDMTLHGIKLTTTMYAGVDIGEDDQKSSNRVFGISGKDDSAELWLTSERETDERPEKLTMGVQGDDEAEEKEEEEPAEGEEAAPAKDKDQAEDGKEDEEGKKDKKDKKKGETVERPYLFYKGGSYGKKKAE